MAAQSPGHLFHRINLRTHRTRAPFVQKLSSPRRTPILPEPLKVFPHQIRPDAAKIVLQQFLQLHRLVVCQILATLQPSTGKQARTTVWDVAVTAFQGVGGRLSIHYLSTHPKHAISIAHCLLGWHPEFECRQDLIPVSRWPLQMLSEELIRSLAVDRMWSDEPFNLRAIADAKFRGV
jgi:hypothetical protein